MPTKYPGDADEVRALNAYICLLRATESLLAKSAQNFRGSKLTASQFAMLECLRFQGPMKPSQLAEKMLKSGGNITMVIDNLEKRKLVQRSPHASDRRAIIISLTSPGNELIESLMPPQVACIKDQMAVLTAGELETLRQLTRRLGTAQ